MKKDPMEELANIVENLFAVFGVIAVFMMLLAIGALMLEHAV
jgi:hypothetical protein